MRRSFVCIAIASSLALSGCASIKETKAITQHNIALTKKLDKHISEPDNTWVSFSSEPYLGSVHDEHNVKLPKILSKKITLISKKERLIDVVDDLSTVSNIPIVITQDAMDFLTGSNTQSSKGGNSNDKALKDFTTPYLSVDYKNISIIDALNRLTRKSNLFWRYDQLSKRVFVFRETTQVFNVQLPTNSYTSNSKISSASNNKDSGGSNTDIGFSSDKVDPWKMVVDGVRSIGKDISVSQMKSRGVLIVKATPDELSQVAQYIKAVNDTSKYGVMVRVYIYSIRVDKSSNYGINWDAIYKSSRGSLAWNTANMSSSSGAGSVAQLASATAKALSGPWSGFNLVIQALQNNTDATSITSGTLFSANGTPVPISAVRRISYVKQVNVSALGGAGSSSNNIQKSVEPGTLQVGNVFVITPRIVDHDRVSIHLAVDNSELDSLVKYQTGTGQYDSSIQLPTTSHKQIIQSLHALHSGQTAIITGFGDSNASVGTNSIGSQSSWWAGGNQGTSRGTTKTVLIITPYIVGDTDD